jgi:hypothetical protein
MKSTQINARHIIVLICGILLGAIPVAITASNEMKVQRLREIKVRADIHSLITEIEQLDEGNAPGLADLKDHAMQIKQGMPMPESDSYE